MKKLILVLAGVTAVLAGAYFGSQLSAQAPTATTTSGASASTPQMAGTRIAVINIGLVFNKYERAKAFKNEIEEMLKPFKEKGKKLTDEAKYWHEEMQKATDAKKKEQFEAGIRNNKRLLEDMQLEVQKLIGKKQEDNLMTLWREVNMGIEAVAKSYGFQVVFGYGDPIEKDMLNMFPNVNRKMQAMDGGSTIPLYVHGSVDLSEHVAVTLNDWCKKK